MSGVMIGMDPHKALATIEVRDEREVLLATGRFGTDTGGYQAMVRYARQWPRRVWAVEGANGSGRPVAQRLLAAGERVLDVPAKLAARSRVFDTGHARKNEVDTDKRRRTLTAIEDAPMTAPHNRGEPRAGAARSAEDGVVPVRQCAPRAATSAAWRRTSRPASRSSRTSPTSAARVDRAIRNREGRVTAP